MPWLGWPHTACPTCVFSITNAVLLRHLAHTAFRYKALDEQCNIDKEKRYVVTIDGHEDVPGFDEGALVKVG